MDRRTYLATAGALVGLAGCSALDGSRGDGDAPSESPADLATSTPDTPIVADTLGCNHIAGTYSFTDRDYLNEGAATVATLGCRSIRVSDLRPAERYPFNSDWPDSFETLVDEYQHPHFRDLFSGPFDTYLLESYAKPPVHEHHPAYWTAGVTDEQYQTEVEAYEAAARHLLETYDGTGKTFVFGHWEGDWFLLGEIDTTLPRDEPSRRAATGMARWLRARQEGVRRAREAVDSDVTVLHSTAVNRVRASMYDDYEYRSSITEVVPNTDVDLVSYSMWELPEEAAKASLPDDQFRATIRETLDYIHERAPEPSAYVRDALGPDQPNVWVCEFGWPLREREDGLERIRTQYEVAVDWGVRWAQYWQVFDNETQDSYDGGRPANEDVRGFYVVRPDGTTAPTWEYFASQLSDADERPDPPFTPRTDEA